jgi:hypothetical protein
MKKGFYILFFLMVMCHQGYGQLNDETTTYINENIKTLKLYLNQIINKSIYYNYYLGDDLYTERSYINDATATLNNKQQIELYVYYKTQKYDVHSSSMISSEHGESVVFDPANITAVKLKGKFSDYSKSQLGLLVINFKDEVEKRTLVQKKKNEDPSLLDSPLVYEFELPFLKTTLGNPEALQRTLLDLQKSFKKEIKIQ